MERLHTRRRGLLITILALGASVALVAVGARRPLGTCRRGGDRPL